MFTGIVTESGNEEENDLTAFVSSRVVKPSRIVGNSNEPPDLTIASETARKQG